MIYAQRIWRGLQLGLDLFFLRLFFLALITPDHPWYCAVIDGLAVSVLIALVMDDFMELRELFKKPRKPRESNGAATD